MRPRLEIRDTLFRVTAELAARVRADEGRPGVTWHEVAAHAQVGRDSARYTMANMAARGELQRVGSHALQGVRRPATLYAPPVSAAPPAGDDAPSVMLLDDVLRGWLPATA